MCSQLCDPHRSRGEHFDTHSSSTPGDDLPRDPPRSGVEEEVLGRGAPCSPRHGLVTVAPAARTSAARRRATRAWRRALQDRTGRLRRTLRRAGSFTCPGRRSTDSAGGMPGAPFTTQGKGSAPTQIQAQAEAEAQAQAPVQAQAQAQAQAQIQEQALAQAQRRRPNLPHGRHGLPRRAS